jgi:hypothetical protein
MTASKSVASQQVDFYDTHLFMERAIARANLGDLPAAGTPLWSALDDQDERKLLALALSGVHHCLRVEVAQSELAAASRAISAADWSAVSREIQQRSDFYSARPWLRRAAS